VKSNNQVGSPPSPTVAISTAARKHHHIIITLSLFHEKLHEKLHDIPGIPSLANSGTPFIFVAMRVHMERWRRGWCVIKADAFFFLTVTFICVTAAAASSHCASLSRRLDTIVLTFIIQKHE